MKAILIIDMPGECGECPVHGYALGMGLCNAVLRACNKNKKPDWCPLQELPEKEEKDGRPMNRWMSGWNACIDEILNKEGAEHEN